MCQHDLIGIVVPFSVFRETACDFFVRELLQEPPGVGHQSLDLTPTLLLRHLPVCLDPRVVLHDAE